MPKCYESTVFSLGIKEVGLYLDELEFASRKDAVMHCAKSFFQIIWLWENKKNFKRFIVFSLSTLERKYTVLLYMKVQTLNARIH